MRFFEELGSLIEQRWRDHNYAEEVFPAVAAQALSEAAPYKNVSPWEVIRWLYNATHIPNQADVPGRFGNPPITLYSGSRFHIDVYYWLDGTTSIHQHAFCGAFQVLVGSSIHSHYSFERTQVINEHFIVGEINPESVELLEQGSVKEILPDKRYIHSLFHLDRPSATICVRTHHTASGGPQYSYLKPYFAIDPFFTDPMSLKQRQSAELLLSLRHPEAIEMIGDLLSRSDFETAFEVLNLARRHLKGNAMETAFGLTVGEEQYQALRETAHRRHGHLIDLLDPVIEEVARQNNLIDRRSQITGGEHRFFLALLLNVPRRETLLEMVKQRFPDRDPVETITNWVDELANTKVMGSSEPNVLAIDGFGEDYLLVLQCMLEGLSIQATRNAFEKEFSADYLASLGEKPEELYNAIRESLLFKAIFLDLPGSTR